MMVSLRNTVEWAAQKVRPSNDKATAPRSDSPAIKIATTSAPAGIKAGKSSAPRPVNIGKTSAPRGSAGGLGRLLWIGPKPLIDPRQKLIVIFSPKSACSSVLVWFLHQIGHAKAAQDFSGWPHEYRVRVYYQSDLYRGCYKRGVAGFKVIRVVRDPYERAASSFRHLLRHATGNLGKVLGMEQISETGMSFSEFLDYLESLDLATCNPHVGLQHHPIEDVLSVDYRINISTENLYTRLNEIETDLDLKRTDLASDAWIQKFQTHHHRRADSELPRGDFYTHRFGPLEAKSGPWPHHDDLLTAEARARIARLFATDMQAYFSGQAGAASTSPVKSQP